MVYTLVYTFNGDSGTRVACIIYHGEVQKNLEKVLTDSKKSVIIDAYKDNDEKEGNIKMLKFTKTAKLNKIKVFSGKTEAQDYLNVLGSLGIDVESCFVGINNNYEHVYFIDEVLDFEELESLLKGYQIEMIARR